MINELPDPVLTQIYRLKAVPGAPVDFGDVPAGRRWVTPFAAGTFTGPELNGRLLQGGSVAWQIASSDGTAAAEIRYTLQTDRGDLLYVRSSGAGRVVVGGEFLFYVTTHVETAAPNLDWLNTGVFVTVAGRSAVTMVYETYLVG